MVSNVKQPEVDSLDILKATIKERQHYKDFYAKIIDDLLDQAEKYKESGGDPSKVVPLNLIEYTDSNEEAQQRKKSLIGLYTPKKGKLPFDQLEAIRRDNGLIVCPSCGELGKPRTLDHYFPKTIERQLPCPIPATIMLAG